ncbi:hypothetical protein JOE40_002902 [Arthrobacter sp. PvP102]|uniref:DUF4235 domain-containing protein n=1 Tax=Micrococcaceae TaxID=1268 RepID=UPI0000526B4B|nr:MULTISPECIES: DUF4235 domain-containing protein [unclassified Arthrobacter]ABK05242.1 hypothetical protein Arth_3867 [Arthrobacter sp. FB24]KIS25772.1 hypothetical protein TV39_20025 [Arthrobacter sp. SPG23]MBP1134355.1 hypothetical protein [Arthrobacter sp. PvP023]MBP1233258.1 hypothetical protein [Arthrobacter sp. PvP103]MBP1238393.1 hypothetical protein [Arthrobacter sp. PvP102]
MSFFIKLLGTGVSLLAGFAGTKAVDVVWEKITGRKPPKGDKDDVPTTLRSALTFALISAAVSAIIQVLANRGTQRAITRFAKSQDIV